MNDAITKLRQQLHQLKSLHESGTLDDQAYATARAPLERKLLDYVLAAPPAAGTAAGAAQAQAPASRLSWNLIGLLTVSVIVVAAGGYMWTGSPRTPSAGAPGAPGAVAAEGASGGAPHSTNDEKFAAAVDKLAERLKGEPDNAEGWSMLARSYARMGRHADAAPAFEKAVALLPTDARLMADFADTLAMQNGRDLEGAPLLMVERALKADPDNAKALALAGTAAFNRKDFASAVRYWERLAKTAPADSGFIDQLQSSIDEARTLAGMPKGVPIQRAAPMAAAAVAPPAATPAATPGAQPVGDQGTAAAAGGALVTGTVRLSAALAKQAAPTDTVFIFARPAEGSRMPLAILRHQVKDLPLTFKLDDSMAMSPAAKMSMFPKIVISARVSKSGQAVQSAGDMNGQSAPIASTSSGVVVEINELVK